MKTAAIIPIKTNNQRLPGKNTKILADKPLYQYLFETVKKCRYLDEIYIDSSDKTILELAKRWEFKTIKRDASLNSPETSGYDLINNELRYINDVDIICQLFVTLPFLRSQTIDSAISLLKVNKSFDSILALYEMQDRFWYRKGNDLIRPVNHNPNELMGTQYMNPVYRESGFYVFRREAYMDERRRVTRSFIEMLVDPNECVDIDTYEDFMFAEMMIGREKSVHT